MKLWSLLVLLPLSLFAQDDPGDSGDPWGDDDWGDEEQVSAWSGFVEAGLG